MQELKLTSLISPSVNHYLGWRAIMKELPNGKKVPMAMSYETGEAKKYKKDFMKYVQQEAKKQNWIMSDNRFQHYYIDTYYYFPRIDMDTNNYWKCMFDAITESKCVWIDDTQACERVQGIYYDIENPRIEMTIHEVDYIGIFKNYTQLDEFVSNCIQCNKYKEGKCGLLCKAKEGRIQNEIQNNICSKFKDGK
jgi:Holliday junction resolvase RusA-like endonuclease